MNKILQIITFCILLFPIPALAHDIDLHMGLWSYHFTKCERSYCPQNGYNEKHGLVGITVNSWMVAYYQNSWYRDSYLITKQWDFNLNQNIRPLIMLGMVTGYDHVSTSVGPFTLGGFIGVDIHPNHDRFGIRVLGIPGKVAAMSFRVSI